MSKKSFGVMGFIIDIIALIITFIGFVIILIPGFIAILSLGFIFDSPSLSHMFDPISNLGFHIIEIGIIFGIFSIPFLIIGYFQYKNNKEEYVGNELTFAGIIMTVIILIILIFYIVPHIISNNQQSDNETTIGYYKYNCNIISENNLKPSNDLICKKFSQVSNYDNIKLYNNLDSSLYIKNISTKKDSDLIGVLLENSTSFTDLRKNASDYNMDYELNANSEVVLDLNLNYKFYKKLYLNAYYNDRDYHFIIYLEKKKSLFLSWILGP